MLAVGTKLIVSVPIQISEDEAWAVGQQAEIVQVDPVPQSVFGGLAYEVQADGGTVASFAEIDLEGEYAWFRLA